MSNAEELVDPSPSYQVVLATWMEFFLLNRKQHLCESDISNLHEKGKDLLRLLSEVLPERTGTKQRNGSLAGWNIWKAHVVVHQAMERMMYGYSETTSAQGAASAHKVGHSFIPIIMLIHMFLHIFICFHMFSQECFAIIPHIPYRNSGVDIEKFNIIKDMDKVMFGRPELLFSGFHNQAQKVWRRKMRYFRDSTCILFCL